MGKRGERERKRNKTRELEEMKGGNDERVMIILVIVKDEDDSEDGDEEEEKRRRYREDGCEISLISFFRFLSEAASQEWMKVDFGYPVPASSNPPSPFRLPPSPPPIPCLIPSHLTPHTTTYPRLLSPIPPHPSLSSRHPRPRRPLKSHSPR